METDTEDLQKIWKHNFQLRFLYLLLICFVAWYDCDFNCEPM